MHKQELFKLGETKVLRIGYSFYTSLPIKWVRNLNVSKGHTLNIYLDQDKRLIIELEGDESD